MKLEQSFEVAAPLEEVWEALIDVERVAPCLPGAAVTGRNDDGSYDGTFKVKIGPTSASYTGKLRMEQVDESVHTATMDAQGTDKRGQGGAKATIVSSLSDAGKGATRVDVSTDYHITGRLARFGRGGMIEDISNRLLNDFATCLKTNLAGGTGEAAPDPPVPADTIAQTDEVQAGAVAAAEAPADAEAEGPAVQATAGTPTEAGAEDPGATAPPPPLPPSPPMQPMPETEPVQGLSLMVSALWGQAKRNPAQAIALVVGFLLALRVFRRRS
jgi:uncharacterized protein